MCGTGYSCYRRPTLSYSLFINPLIASRALVPTLDFMPSHCNYIITLESFIHLIFHICLINLQSQVNSALCFLNLLSQSATHSWRELYSLLCLILFVLSHSSSSHFSYSPGAPGPRGSFISEGDLTPFAAGIKDIRLDFTFHPSNLNFFLILILPFQKELLHPFLRILSPMYIFQNLTQP